MKMGFLEDLHTIISKIHNNDETLWGHTNSRGSVKLPRSCSIGSKLAKKISVWLEYLHTMVLGICHDDISFLIDSDTLWAQKLSVGAPFCSKKSCSLKIRMYHQESMIIEVCNNHLTLVVKAHPSWRVEVLPQGSFKAIFVDELSILCEKLHTVVPGIRN